MDIGKIGYLIPEFPGQTHTWIWREITHMREWGQTIQIFSTRRPTNRDRARHAWSEEAVAGTSYLWPRPILATLGAVVWAAIRHPVGFLRCIWLVLTLPVIRRPRLFSVGSLLPPACILARESERIGIVHLHSHSCASGAILAMMLKRITRIPYSLTLNANIEWWGGAMREKFSDATFVISITQRLLDQIHREFPDLAAGQALLGRIGVDTRKWLPGRHDDDSRIVTVGRMHPSKGHDILLRAVKEVTRARPDVTLCMIGDGPQRAELEALADKLGLRNRVIFTGSASEDQIIEELRRADIFALASHAEPLGVVFMEAMSMAVATIGTAAGGVNEIITDGSDGLLVPPGDVAAMASAIRTLLDNTSRRRALGAAGRNTIVRNFDSRIGAATLYQCIHGVTPESSEAIR
jgi:glycosyltransferase involved in cell wall biosynthesis